MWGCTPAVHLVDDEIVLLLQCEFEPLVGPVEVVHRAEHAFAWLAHDVEPIKVRVRIPEAVSFTLRAPRLILGAQVPGRGAATHTCLLVVPAEHEACRQALLLDRRAPRLGDMHEVQRLRGLPALERPARRCCRGDCDEGDEGGGKLHDCAVLVFGPCVGSLFVATWRRGAMAQLRPNRVQQLRTETGLESHKSQRGV